MLWFYREFGARVRQARGDQLTQEALARRVGLSRASVANIERGRQRVPLHMLYLLGQALGVDPASLIPAPPESEAAARRELIAMYSTDEQELFDKVVSRARRREEERDGES